MEDVYRRFDSYDFDGDKRFQDGLRSLEMSTIKNHTNKVLEVKLFFYNQFVEPIDIRGYKTWCRIGSSGAEVLVDCSTGQLEELRQLSISDSDISKTTAKETPPDKCASQLSFGEVFLLVQAGKDVPGVVKVDIQPSNQNPTPSRMEKTLKPWEISVSK